MDIIDAKTVNFAPLNVHTSTKYIDLDGALQTRFDVRISFTDTSALTLFIKTFGENRIELSGLFISFTGQC